MKVKQLIKQLKELHNEDDDIIADVWAKADVDWIENVSDKQWKKLVDRFDGYDYQQVGDDISYQLREIMEEDKITNGKM